MSVAFSIKKLLWIYDWLNDNDIVQICKKKIKKKSQNLNTKSLRLMLFLLIMNIFCINKIVICLGVWLLYALLQFDFLLFMTMFGVYLMDFLE
jgi:hypothetical protein